MSFAQGLLLLLILLVLSAFFSMSELALASARRFRLQTLADEGDARALAVMALQAKPGNFFTVVQIGQNAVAILGGVIGDELFSPGIQTWLGHLGVPATIAESTAFVVSFLLTVSLFIQFADLIPKRLGLQLSESVAVRIVAPMRWLTMVLRPVVWLFDGFANWIFRLFGMSMVRTEGATVAEIVAMADSSVQAGTLPHKEHHLLGNMLRMDRLTVGSAMTPRDQVVFISCKDSDAEIKAKLVMQPHSRYLLCEEGIDSVFACLYAKDLLRLVLQDHSTNFSASLRQVANTNLLLLPDTLSISDLLDRFNEAREDFAIIMNEYALVVGVVTLYDVASQLVDGVALNDSQGWVVARDDHSWLVDGQTPVEDLRKILEIDYFPGEEGYETVAGFLMHMLKRIPLRAEVLEFAGYRFEVLDVDHHKVDQILVSRLSLLESK